MKKLLTLLLILISGSPFLLRATTPTGSDNQGGISAPAGTYSPSPNVSSVGLNPYTGNATRIVNDLSVTSVSEVGLNWKRFSNSRSIIYNPELIDSTSQFILQFGNGGNWSHSFRWVFGKGTVNSVPTIEVIYPSGVVNDFTREGDKWSCRKSPFTN